MNERADRTPWAKLRRDPVAIAGAIVTALVAALALAAPVLFPGDPLDMAARPLMPPFANWAVPLGTDRLGRDLLAGVVHGARASLMVGVSAAAIGLAIGMIVGATAGFFGGWVDTLLMRITDVFLVIPDLPLIIVVAAIFGRHLINIIIIIGIIYWTSTARLVRAQVKSVRERVYVKRARSIGAGNRRLVFKHVLPQVAPLLIANTVLTIALAVFLETYITFLGLGDPSSISWGKLIENSFLGNAVLNNAWWAVVPPGVAVTIVILACTMVGQSMEDALNPRLRVGHLAVRRFRLRPLHGQLESE
jgi:peptide/nickel transport system permease protein